MPQRPILPAPMTSALLQFLLRPPQGFELAALPADANPVLHEWQIRSNQAWWERRSGRVERHQEYIAKFLSRTGRPSRRGKRTATWCVELQVEFASVTAAARFVGRAPTNLSRAMRIGRPCGQFHWEPFNPQKHLRS